MNCSHQARPGRLAAGTFLPLLIGLASCTTTETPSSPQRPGDDVNLATIPFLSQPVTIDGELSDPAWASAARLTGFVRFDSLELAQKKTSVFVYHDAERLYFGFKCEGDDISRLSARATERDDYPKEEDRVDVFLDVNRDQETYVYIIVNTLGTTFDMRCDSPIAAAWSTEWNPDVSSATKVHPDHWTAELAIPFEGLGARQPEPGDVWGLNVCRGSYSEMPGGEELSCWTRVRGSFHQPESFGLARFGGGESPVTRLIELATPGPGEGKARLEFVNPGPLETEIVGRLRMKPAGSRPSTQRRRVPVPAGGRREMEFPIGEIKPGMVELDLQVSASPGPGVVLRTRMDLAHFPAAEPRDPQWVVRLDGLYKDASEETSVVSIEFKDWKQELMGNAELEVRLRGSGGEEIADRSVRLTAATNLSLEFPLGGLRPGQYEYQLTASDITTGHMINEARKSFRLMPLEKREAPGDGQLPGFFIGLWGRPGPNLQEHGIRGSGFNTVIGEPPPNPGELRSFHPLGRGEDHVGQAVEAAMPNAAVGGWFLQYEADSRGVHPDELAPYTTLVRSLDGKRPVAIHLSNIGSLETFFSVADLLIVNAMWGDTRLDVALQVIDEAHRKITEAGKSAGYWFYMWGNRHPAEFRLAAMYAVLKGDKGIVFHLGDGALTYDDETWSMIRGIEWETALLSSILVQSEPAKLVEVIEPAPVPASRSADVLPAGPLFIKTFRAMDRDYVTVLNPQPLAAKFRARLNKKYRGAHVLFDESEVTLSGGILEDSIPPFGVKTYRLSISPRGVIP
jgi:hypothetical protein